MKRNQLTKNIFVISFLSLLVVAAAGSVGAFGSETGECGTSGCHDTAGVLTLSSNSTSLSATTGEAFVLEIQAGNGAEWIKVISDWEDNAEFSISQAEIEDGSANDTNAATEEITVDLTFIPLSAGDYTIRIWTAAASDLASFLDIAVTVTGAAITTAPTTSAPPPVDLVGTWRIMMILVPVATGVILLLLGIVAFKSNE
ncbi:MAG: hypothetical protein ACTSSE_04970 [Candidatus Thorarchaeota archaeon]